MNHWRLTPTVTKAMVAAVRDCVFPGVSLATIDGEGNGEGAIQDWQCGHVRYADDTPCPIPLVRADTIYDVASVTKIIGSIMAAALVSAKELKLSDPIRKYLPQYQGEGRDSICVADLLAYRVPFDLVLSDYKHLTAEEILHRIWQAPLRGQSPSDIPVFINTTSVIISSLLQKVSGMSVREWAEDQLFTPLQLKNTFFYPDRRLNTTNGLSECGDRVRDEARNRAWDKFKDKFRDGARHQAEDEVEPTFAVHDRVAPTEYDPWRQKLLQGEVHDESAWVLSSIMTPGSAGLFSTAPDLAKILGWQLHTASGMGKNQTAITLGWEQAGTASTAWMGHVPRDTYGKTGFTGCAVIWNARLQRAGVMLSNAVHPRRPVDRRPLQSIRALWSEDVMSA